MDIELTMKKFDRFGEPIVWLILWFGVVRNFPDLFPELYDFKGN